MMDAELSREIDRAVAALAMGGVIGMPTETVYGLAADATHVDAVRRIFSLKGRPTGHPLIVHLASADVLSDWAIDIPECAFALARELWPGPLTMILRRHRRVPDEVTGGLQTVGIRVPAHPVALDLLSRFGRRHSGAVAAPSANRFGRISPTRAEHVHAEFGSTLDLILDGGPSDIGIESTIIDLSGKAPAVLRPGGISRQELDARLGLTTTQPKRPRVAAPGTLAAHYAPRTALELVETEELENRISEFADRRVALLRWRSGKVSDALVVDAGNDPVQYARRLYDLVRQLDAAGFARIFVEAPPQDPTWAAIADRLGRAAAAHEASSSRDLASKPS